MKVYHRCWRKHCLCLYRITFLGLIYPFLDVWIPIGPTQVFSPIRPSIILNYQTSFHPSSLHDTLIPPSYFCTHLNSVQLSWTHREYISPTRLNKPFLGCVKTRDIHRVYCDHLSAKDVYLCRMYWLDKSVRIVAIMLLVWFGYHSKMMQSTLSGIFTSSIFGWCFQNRRALHCFTLRSYLLKTWGFHTVDVNI